MSTAVDAMTSPAHDLLQQAHQTFSYWMKKGEPRVRDWPLMRVDHMLMVVCAYLLLILTLALLMRFRSKPFQVRAFATVHNLVLTLLSLYMLVEILRQAYVRHYSLFGNGVEHGFEGYGMARILHIFYLSKTLEFIDTVIMCLKKNFHQITFLHVYHHASIFVIWYVIVYFAPGGEAYFSAALNSAVHVVMYGYYLWSTYAPKLAEGLKPGLLHPARYKRYITTMQMTQFSVMMLQATYDLLVPSDYPRFCVWILFVYMWTMLALFGNFFVRQYISKAASNKSRGAAKADGRVTKKAQ